jgi:hypothetical protein
MKRPMQERLRRSQYAGRRAGWPSPIGHSLRREVTYLRDRICNDAQPPHYRLPSPAAFEAPQPLPPPSLVGLQGVHRH